MIDRAALADLRQRDYARYLALWLVPEADRAFALALFDLAAELQVIPAKVTEPTLGLLRIVWWRDAAADGAVRAHPLLQGLRPHLGEAGRAALVAEWVESFDLPFLPEAEQNERLQVRHGLEAQLLGKAVVQFLNKSLKDPQQGRLMLAIQALRASF